MKLIKNNSSEKLIINKYFKKLNLKKKEHLILKMMELI